MQYEKEFDGFKLRQVCMDDLQDYYTLIDTNRKRLEDFFAGTVALTKNLEDTKAHLEDVIAKAEKRNYFPFIVVDMANNKLVASLQVKSVDWSVPKAELGYYVDKQYEGRGIVTKATAIIVDFCFNELRLNKIYIRTSQENPGSMRVAEKNGFVVEGMIRKDYKTTSGRLIDTIYYGLVME